MNPGFWGIVVIVVAVIVLFGRGKVAGMMGEFGAGIKAFQRGMKDEEQSQISEQKDKNTTDA
ncbi:MAG: twin-arginine translocase TatA/TatE family subunit [Hyphomicrobiaceae bacterium]|nr:twin-arginine translocase TatA/TatE family subunit [Hyphomicrobiaceae bacterium]